MAAGDSSTTDPAYTGRVPPGSCLDCFLSGYSFHCAVRFAAVDVSDAGRLSTEYHTGAVPLLLYAQSNGLDHR